MVNTYTPERGDIVWLVFDPQAGHEQAGRRPAMVISPSEYNGKIGLALVCPITGQVKNYPFEVVLPGGLPVSGVVLADQLKSLEWRVREAKYICTLPQAVIEDTIAKIITLIE